MRRIWNLQYLHKSSVSPVHSVILNVTADWWFKPQLNCCIKGKEKEAKSPQNKMLHHQMRRSACVSQAVAADAGRNSIVLCIVVNQMVIWMSHQSSAVFSAYGHLTRGGRAVFLGGFRVFSVYFVFFGGREGTFFCGEVTFGRPPHHTPPPSNGPVYDDAWEQAWSSGYDWRARGMKTVGWKLLAVALNANMCASGGDVTVSWLGAVTKSLGRRNDARLLLHFSSCL